MIIAVGILALIVGFFIGGAFFRKIHDEEIAKLNKNLTDTTSKAADKLSAAYEKIEQLTKDNKNLTKLLLCKNKE